MSNGKVHPHFSTIFGFFFKLLTTAISYRVQEGKRALGDANLNCHTFHQLIYQCTQVVGLFLLPFTHLNHICQVLTNILEQLGSHFHLSLKEPEQRILMVKTFKVSCRSKLLLENCYEKQTPKFWVDRAVTLSLQALNMKMQPVVQKVIAETVLQLFLSLGEARKWKSQLNN